MSEWQTALARPLMQVNIRFDRQRLLAVVDACEKAIGRQSCMSSCM
jgi:hypothetical protein